MADKFFEVVVEGQYHALHDTSGTATLKNYRAVFNLPTQEAALSIICKHLLTPYLRKKYHDFIRYHTHRLVSITLHGYKPNTDVLQEGIEEMSLKDLYDFCILREILIDPYKHSNKPIEQIRELVARAYREKRQLQKDNTVARQGVDAAEGESLRKANELPPEDTVIRLSVNEQILMQQRNRGQEQAQAQVAIDENIIADEPLPPEVQDESIFK